MANLIKEHPNFTARKVHLDSSQHWIENGLDDLDGLTFAEKRAIVDARRRNWRILPGMKYSCSIVVDNGSIYAYKTLPVFNEICQRLELWQD